MNQSGFQQYLSEKLKTLRTRENLTQEQFGGLFDLSRTSVINIEKGTQLPNTYLLWKISDHFRTDLCSFLPKLDSGKRIDNKLLGVQNENDREDILKLYNQL